MGTDIHVVAQFFNFKGEWEDCHDIPPDIENRNYTWFSFLDGCRLDLTNRERGKAIIPLTSGRGCPDGFQLKEPDQGSYDVDTYHGDIWMGYGVSSWCLVSELRPHIENQPADEREHLTNMVDGVEKFFIPLKLDRCRLVWGYDS